MQEAPEQNGSEPATPYKIEQARKKGAVARSVELTGALVILCFLGYGWMRGSDLVGTVSRVWIRTIGDIPSHASDSGQLLELIGQMAALIASALAPLVLVLGLASLLVLLMQVGWLWAPVALKPDFSKLNPVSGLKRVFSGTTIKELVKTIAKLGFFIALGIWFLNDLLGLVPAAASSTKGFAVAVGIQTLRAILVFGAVLLFFGIIDILLVRRDFAKKMRMTKREIVQEMRQREGDPRIKQRRRQLGREMLKRAQSLRKVKHADLLIVNPTHYVVALKFDATTMQAPVILAKGAGDFAERLRRMAFVYGIPIFRAPSLARRLHFKVALASTIGVEYFEEVAKIYLQLKAQRHKKGMSR